MVVNDIPQKEWMLTLGNVWKTAPNDMLYIKFLPVSAPRLQKHGYVRKYLGYISQSSSLRNLFLLVQDFLPVCDGEDGIGTCNSCFQ
jgi:hypothetical protein